MGNLAQVALVYSDALPEAPFDEFAKLVSSPGLDLKVASSEQRGPQAGIEWLLPTAAILYLGKSYFDGFLKEMGKDHYNALKRGAERLWASLVAPDREIVVHVFSTRGKVNPTDTVSRIFSIYSDTPDGGRIKFLFEDGLEREEFMRAFQATLDALEDYHTGNPRSLIRHGIVNANIPRHTYLLRFNRDTEKLEMIDIHGRFPAG
jgi:hypothetical protein